MLTAERPAVLVLADLHWSGPSTVERLAALARRREAARLLLRPYRPVGLITTNQPLKAVMQEGDGTRTVLRPLENAGGRRSYGCGKAN